MLRKICGVGSPPVTSMMSASLGDPVDIPGAALDAVRRKDKVQRKRSTPNRDEVLSSQDCVAENRVTRKSQIAERIHQLLTVRPVFACIDVNILGCSGITVENRAELADKQIGDPVSLKNLRNLLRSLDHGR